MSGPGASALIGAYPDKGASIVGGGHEPARSVSFTSQTMERWSNDRSRGPAKPKHIWAIRQHLKSVGLIRDLAMFNIALDAKLRGCDLVKLRLGDIAQGGVIRQRSTIVQQKTGRPVPFGITEAAREALAHWLERRGRRPNDWPFPNPSRDGEYIGTIGEIKRRVQIADGIASPGERRGEGAPVFRGEVTNGDAGAERAGWGPPGSIGQGSRRRRHERPPHRTVGSRRRRTRHER